MQEIYDLRVLAYEHSPKATYVNKQTFPNGWFDNLDDRAQTLHWIVEDNHKIIASARLAILDDINDTNEAFDKFELPFERPFAYWSRLVVHPEYRRMGAMMLLDAVRKTYLIDNPDIHFALCCVTPDRSKIIERLGFKYLGEFMYNWNGPEQVILGYIIEKSPQGMYMTSF